MKKVLVPTDFSANSKAGIRFAFRWSAYQHLELVFIHVAHPIKEKKDSQGKLVKFIAAIARNMHAKTAGYSCIVIDGYNADVAIIDYCTHHRNFDFICISTKGAGGIKRLYGTNTGNVITKSPVPVLAIPAGYKSKPIKRILYAADLDHYTPELTKVSAFAKPLKAQVEILHIFSRNQVFKNIRAQIEKLKPSLVVMFTNQDRSLLQKLFMTSKAERLSFDLKTPLLVFRKNI